MTSEIYYNIPIINSNFTSCSNYGGCYISSALPLERKNFKYFSKKFAKKSKSKGKNINDKKQFIKSISAINGNGFKNDDEQEKQSSQDKSDYIQLLKDDSDFEGNI